MSELTRYDVTLSTQQVDTVLSYASATNPSFRNVLLSRFTTDDPSSLTTEISHPNVDNVCNAVFFLTLRHNEHPNQVLELVLKIILPRYKTIKTLNEVKVMQFLWEHVRCVKCPQIFTFDLEGSVMGYEFILMERVKGIPLSQIYESLSFEEKKSYMEQLSQIRKAISDVKFKFKDMEGTPHVTLFGNIHEITVNDNVAEVTVGPNVDGEGPFTSFSEFIVSQMEERLEALENTQNGRFLEFKPYFESMVNE